MSNLSKKKHPSFRKLVAECAAAGLSVKSPKLKFNDQRREVFCGFRPCQLQPSLSPPVGFYRNKR